MTEGEALKTMDLKPGASKDQIKAQFRKLAIEHHPDKNQGRSEKWNQISAAHDFLTSANKTFVDGELEKARKRLAVIRQQISFVDSQVVTMSENDPRIEQMYSPLRFEEKQLLERIEELG